MRCHDKTGHVVAGPFTGHTSFITSVAFSPEGPRIASASDDSTIRAWDVTTGQIGVDWSTGYGRGVEWVRSVADGQYAASTPDDCAIHVAKERNRRYQVSFYGPIPDQ
jgi:WD40 repeat protein